MNFASRRGPLAAFLFGTAGFGLFAWLFYIRYYKWIDCFNDLGRCYDPDGSHEVYTTAGQMWGVLAIPFLLMMIVGAILLMRRR